MCNYPGNFAECPSSPCFHDNLTCGPKTNWAGTASDWTDEQVSTVLDERPECYGCVPIPTVYRPVIRISDVPIQFDGTDLNGLYYSYATYNGFPFYYNTFNKSNVSISIWKMRDISYPRNGLSSGWMIDWRTRETSDWSYMKYAYYSSQSVFTPDLVTSWYNYATSDDADQPTISVEPPTNGLSINSLEYDGTYIHLTVTKDAAVSVELYGDVYISDADFWHGTCALFDDEYLPVKFEESYWVGHIEDNPDDNTKLDLALIHSKGPIGWAEGADEAPHQCGGYYSGGGKLVVI